MTVTDTSVVITWFTGSASAVDAFGFPAPVQTGPDGPADVDAVPGRGRRVARLPRPVHDIDYTAYLLDQNQAPVESVEFLEVGATKEYPGGYSLLRLYTGGYMVSYPHYMLGTIADRNHTVTRDLSGLRKLS